MATIITRETGATAKGSPLTNAEVDANFINLNTEVTPTRPDIKPSILFDFVNSKSVDTRLKFSRASGGSRMNEKGLVSFLRNDQPRFGFDSSGNCEGLLIEDQKTNLFRNSECFNMAPWVGNSGGGDARADIFTNTIAPDGTASAYKIHSIAACSTYSQPIYLATGTYYLSWYQKVGSGNPVNTHWTYSASGVLTASSATTIETLRNGWIRRGIALTVTTAGTFDIGVHMGCWNSQPVGAQSDWCYFWGFQLETGSFATSYIKSSPTFTSRASSATYLDSAGIVRTAGNDQERVEYAYNASTNSWVLEGRLLENAATNLILRSTVTEIGSAWQQYNGATLSANYTTAPDNSSTAGRILVASGSTGTVRIGSATIASNTQYTASIWLKSNTSSNYTLIIQIGDTDVKSVTVTPRWQRFSGFGNPQQNGYNFIDLETIQSNADIAVWGAQLETGPHVTSYIPTVAGSASRAADVFTHSQTTRNSDSVILNNSELFRSIDFSVCGEAKPFGSQTGRIVTLAPSESDSSNVISVNYEPAYFRTYQYYNSALRFNTAGAGYIANTVQKFALGIDSSGFSSVTNSYLEGGTGQIEMPITSMRIGSMNTGQYFMSGFVRKISYFTKRLPNSQLTALTK
jgi:hypothetical protein